MFLRRDKPVSMVRHRSPLIGCRRIRNPEEGFCCAVGRALEIGDVVLMMEVVSVRSSGGKKHLLGLTRYFWCRGVGAFRCLIQMVRVFDDRTEFCEGISLGPDNNEVLSVNSLYLTCPCTILDVCV